jgi:hypothetical protein
VVELLTRDEQPLPKIDPALPAGVTGVGVGGEDCPAITGLELERTAGRVDRASRVWGRGV